jgi:hypothetical protein
VRSSLNLSASSHCGKVGWPRNDASSPPPGRPRKVPSTRRLWPRGSLHAWRLPALNGSSPSVAWRKVQRLGAVSAPGVCSSHASRPVAEHRVPPARKQRRCACCLRAGERGRSAPEESGSRCNGR